MKKLFVCYPKCSTCQKAKAWLDDKCIEYEFRDIKLNNPTEKELTAWIKLSGYPIKKFFNTSGLIYREMELSKKLPSMSDQDKIKLLATNGMLVKRPILVDKNKVYIGFKVEEWEGM